MPRVSDVYAYPAGTEGVPDTTISSSKYNAYIADVQYDLNAPRPIVAGGTGASSATAARDNLGAEASRVQVTNYDTHPFQGGSFFSLTSAFNPPVSGHAFAGIAYLYDANNLVVEARDLNDASNPGVKWVREKQNGVWTGWTSSINYIGSITTTGDITVDKVSPTLYMNKPMNGDSNISIIGQTNYKLRWKLTLGDAIMEDLNQVDSRGSNFSLFSSDDRNTGFRQVLYITRATGEVLWTSEGDHRINQLNPRIALEKTATANDCTIVGRSGLINRWSLSLAAGTADGFQLGYYNAGGAYVGAALYGLAGTGEMRVGYGNPTDAQGICNKAYADLKLALAGGTMTGDLRIAKSSPAIILDKNVTGEYNSIWGRTGTYNRWRIDLGSTDAESGSGVGSSFIIWRFNDVGTPIDAPFNINRATGAVSVATELDVANKIFTTGYLQINALNSTAWPATIIADETGAFKCQFGWNRTDNDIRIYSYLAGADAGLTVGGAWRGGKGYVSKRGNAGVLGANWWNFYWNGTNLEGWIDGSNMGNVGGITSDYRIKKDVADLGSMWDTVKAMRPISYTQAEYSPPPGPSSPRVGPDGQELADQTPPPSIEQAPVAPMFEADNIKRWGFIAHELQDALLPTAASGVKDSPNIVQALNLAPIVAALTKALQEAMARIEALEAAAG